MRNKGNSVNWCSKPLIYQKKKKKKKIQKALSKYSICIVYLNVVLKSKEQSHYMKFKNKVTVHKELKNTTPVPHHSYTSLARTDVDVLTLPL